MTLRAVKEKAVSYPCSYLSGSVLEGDNLLARCGPIDVKKLLKASAISGAEFIVSLSVLISVILRFVQDLRELSSLISLQILEEFFLLNSKLCKKY